MGVYAHGAGVIELPLIDFAPDLAYDTPNLQRGVQLIDMDNAMPTMKGYQALNSILPYLDSAPLPETVLGSTVAYFSNDADFNTGTAKIFAGTPTNIYRLDGNIWTPVAPGQNVTGRWRFGQWGNDLIAVNPSTAPLVATGITGTFAPLAGGPPNNATTLVSVNGQVLMFAGSNWYCSALDTDSVWTPDIQTQAGQGVLYDYPGPIVAAAPIFRNVVVFKETATWLLTYVGGYPIWSNQLISDLTGTWCQESVIVMPDSIAFVGCDDFYLCSGYTPQRIPNSLKEWFFDVADPEEFKQMLSRYDKTHGVCYWYFVTKTPPYAHVPDRWVAWNPRTGRWGSGYITEGALSVPYPNQQPCVLTGLFFDFAQQLDSWTGPPGTMRLATGYFGSPNLFSQVMRVRPMYYVHPDKQTLRPYHTTNLGDADITGPTTFLNQRDGWFYFRQSNRWHRFQVDTVGPNILPTEVSQTGAEISAFAVELRQGGWR